MILRSTVIVGGMTGLSRILGFLRDMVIAKVFGAGPEVDAFIVAFRIPNLLRRLFAEGAFAQAFVPVLADLRAHAQPAAVKAFIDAIAGHLTISLAGVAAVGSLAAPLLILLFSPGFAGQTAQFDLAADLLRIVFPYIFFIALVALAAGIQNAYGQFAIPAVTPAMLNIAMIGAALFLTPWLPNPIYALAWGVVAGGIAQLALQLPVLIRRQLMPTPRCRSHDPSVRRVWQLMLPALFGASIGQINILVNTITASFLVSGSLSWLYYADRLMELPLGLFGIALGTTLLPNLARQYALQARHDFSATIDWGLRMTILLIVPSAAALAALAYPILCTLFQYGEFAPDDLLMTSRSLIAYAAGLLGLSLVKVLAPGFFARQDTATPMRIGVQAVLANIGLNIVLAPVLGHTGLALATSLSALLQASLLYARLRATGCYRAAPGWPLFLLRVAVATGAMIALVTHCADADGRWLDYSAIERATRLLTLVVFGIAVYFSTLWTLGLRRAHMTGAEATV